MIFYSNKSNGGSVFKKSAKKVMRLVEKIEAIVNNITGVVLIVFISEIICIK